MKSLSTIQTRTVSGALATMSGRFILGMDVTKFENGFYISVTNNSSNVLRNFAAYPNKVVNLATNEVLFDGTQNSFCIDSNSFSVTLIKGGHKYKYIGSC